MLGSSAPVPISNPVMQKRIILRICFAEKAPLELKLKKPVRRIDRPVLFTDLKAIDKGFTLFVVNTRCRPHRLQFECNASEKGLLCRVKTGAAALRSFLLWVVVPICN